jgi:16S rRNA U516 pseudouridylate synthase RsuA-like enzyme
MNNVHPIFDSATYYHIEVRGRVDVDWLQSFDGSAEISVNETRPMEDITVLKVHTDQSGMVGLVRRLHGLGMTILQLQIVLSEGKAAEVEEQR